MRRPSYSGFGLRLSNRPNARRSLTLAMVVLFSFQLSRFYLIAHLDPLICSEPNHQHSSSLAATHEHPTAVHKHSHEDAGSLPHSHDEGFFFQHCKDSYDGIGLTPAQPLGLPVTASPGLPETVWTMILPDILPRAERFLPPPFQPPRTS